MGLKNMSDLRDLCFTKTMLNMICCLKVHKISFQGKNCSYNVKYEKNNSTVK